MNTLIRCTASILLCSQLAFGQVIKPGNTPDALTTDSGMFRPLITSKDTQGAYATSEIMEHTNYMTSLHRHNTFDESYYVLAGYLTVHLNGRTHRLGPGVVSGLTGCL